MAIYIAFIIRCSADVYNLQKKTCVFMITRDGTVVCTATYNNVIQRRSPLLYRLATPSEYTN